jgi:hypothetical protein
MNYQQALLNYLLTSHNQHTVPEECMETLEQLDKLGNTLSKMFRNKELTRMWIDKETGEVHVS